MTAPLRSIVLIGFMGSGKSSVGRRLAQTLGWPRRDTDELVAAAAGMSIPGIFAHGGETQFRAAESDVLTRMSAKPPSVIVTGGGIVLRTENVSRLREIGTVVWLTASLDVLRERLARRRNRPLLQTSDPAATIARLLEERRKFYEAAADLTVDTSELDHAQVAEAVRRAIQAGS